MGSPFGSEKNLEAGVGVGRAGVGKCPAGTAFVSHLDDTVPQHAQRGLAEQLPVRHVKNVT